MKTLIKLYSLIVILALCFACETSDDDDDNNGSGSGNNNLIASIAIKDSLVSPGDTVWLYGISNKEGSNFTWNVSGSETFSLTGDTTSFVPTINGTYSISLEVKQSSEFTNAYSQVIVSGAIMLAGTIDDWELKDVDFDATAYDYIVTEDVIFSSNLTIPWGVNIGVMEGKSITFKGLTATSGGVVFTTADSLNETRWKGILMENGNISMNSVTVAYGGSAPLKDTLQGNIVFAAHSNITTLSGCTIAHSGAKGVVIENKNPQSSGNFGQSIPLYNNIFISNNDGPYLVPIGIFSSQNLFSGDDFSAEASGNRHIEIYGSTINGQAYFITNSSDTLRFKISGDLTFTSNGLMILPNSGVLEFTMGKDVAIYAQTFRVNTSSTSSRVIFKGENDAYGNWKGIFVSGNAFFVNTEIHNAGGKLLDNPFSTEDPSEKASVYVRSGTLQEFNNCVVRNSGGIGLYVNPDVSWVADTMRYVSNTFESNVISCVRVEDHAVSLLVNSTSSFSPFSANVATVEVLGFSNFSGSSIADHKWMSLGPNSAYHIMNDPINSSNHLSVPSGKSLTIGPGAVVKFDTEQGIRVEGDLIVGDTLSLLNQVRMIGLNDGPGSWKGLIFLSGGTSSIKHTIIEDGGATWQGFTDVGNVIVGGTGHTVTITNSFIQDCLGYGVVLLSGAIDTGINDLGNSGNLLNGELGGFLQN